MLYLDYIVNSVFNSRTYILGEENSDFVWLIDCGDFDKVLKKIGKRTVKGVLLTHAHFDHIYGIPDFLEHFPDGLIYTNNFGVDALADDRLNMSRYHGIPLSIVSKNILKCGEGDAVPLFDAINALVYYTPGHNPSCLTFEVENYLFTGDAYIPGIKVVTTLPKGDKSLAKQSVQRILDISEGKVICSGHELV